MAILRLRSLTALVLLAAAMPAAAWTDGAPVAGVTRVKAVHLVEIGTAVNQRLAACGLPAAPVPSPGPAIRAADFNAARASVAVLYSAFGRPAPSWTGGPTLAAGDRIRLVHLAELRAAVDAASAWPCPGGCAGCTAGPPACGETTSGVDSCGNACSRVGPACACVPNGSCSAAIPACGQTTSGVDNCGNACSLTGMPCNCVPDGSCTAAAACGRTTSGVDNCGNPCTVAGPPRRCENPRNYPCAATYEDSCGEETCTGRFCGMMQDVINPRRMAPGVCCPRGCQPPGTECE